MEVLVMVACFMLGSFLICWGNTVLSLWVFREDAHVWYVWLTGWALSFFGVIAIAGGVYNGM